MLQYVFVQSVKIHTGAGAIADIGALIQEAGYHKAFLVCTKGMVKRGLIARIQGCLRAAGVDSVIYDAAEPDPPAEIVDQGAARCKEHHCDCVVAIGGGSSMDAAKGINILRFNAGSILDYTTAPIAPSTGLIVVPTTSGTGSELSNGAIISDTEHNLKLPIPCVNCMPEYAILDPELTVSVPRHVTVETGLDTFSHAAEAYTSAISNPMSDLVCQGVMEYVVRFLPRAAADGGDLDARQKMQVASAIGGWMLYQAAAHVGHSFAHVTGAKLHLVHGAACAYGLPGVLKLIAPAMPDKVRRIGEILGVVYTGTETPEEIAQAAGDAYRRFVAGLGLPQAEPLDEGQIPDLAAAIVSEPFAGLCPVPVTQEKAERMLRDAFAR